MVDQEKSKKRLPKKLKQSWMNRRGRGGLKMKRINQRRGDIKEEEEVLKKG